MACSKSKLKSSSSGFNSLILISDEVTEFHASLCSHFLSLSLYIYIRCRVNMLISQSCVFERLFYIQNLASYPTAEQSC
jgi:hypothetical protein